MRFAPLSLISATLHALDEIAWGNVARTETHRRRCALSGWQRWHTRRQLAQLDDRQLADIGLTREMARRESHRPFWR